MQQLVAHCALAADYCGQVKPPASHFHIGSPQSLIRRPDKTDEQRWGQGPGVGNKNPRGRDLQRRHLNASLHILSNTNVFSVSVVIWSGSSRCPVSPRLQAEANATQRSPIYLFYTGILPMGDGRSESLAPCFHIYLSSPLRPRHISAERPH